MRVLGSCLPRLLGASVLGVSVLGVSVLGVSFVIGLGMPASAQPDEGVVPGPRRVLFVGNSHTARNGGLDWQVGNFVAAADPALEFRGWTETASGATLEDHFQRGVAERIRLGGYDAVVLQGHLPGHPSGGAESFVQHARLLHAAVAESGARTVFLMTWPQARLAQVDLDDIVVAHRQIADLLDVDVAPAAIAMELARSERPDLVLIGEDGTHATWAGAYLTAATTYAALFHRTPEGLPYTFGVGDEDAAFLQRIAWQAVTAWQAETASRPTFVPSADPASTADPAEADARPDPADADASADPPWRSPEPTRR